MLQLCFRHLNYLSLLMLSITAYMFGKQVPVNNGKGETDTQNQLFSFLIQAVVTSLINFFSVGFFFSQCQNILCKNRETSNFIGGGKNKNRSFWPGHFLLLMNSSAELLGSPHMSFPLQNLYMARTERHSLVLAALGEGSALALCVQAFDLMFLLSICYICSS